MQSGKLSVDIRNIYRITIHNRHISYSGSGKNSAAKEPTPPKPTTSTFALISFSNPSSLSKVPFFPASIYPFFIVCKFSKFVH
jgi:hypothetical protein